ncbi:MAG: zinc transporter ZupT [Candidatus Altiarchaeota archaeon]|nr:zinc transporter ZupT [Candidatus Altiarchaeota archaeon]
MGFMMDTSQIWLPLLLTFLAGIATGIGSLISLFIKKLKKSYLCFSLGFSAGVMIYVSFAELLSSAVADIGFLMGNTAFFAGIIFILLIDFSIPHEYIEEHVEVNEQNRKLMMAGVFTALGIAIHNFPEGLAVFMSSLKDIDLGISLAFAIAVHNIPEGIAVSMPIFYATKSRKKAFSYSLLSGIAEPIGAIIGYLILRPFLTPTVLSFMLAFVAGIMVFISFDELLPLSFEHENAHISIVGIILGMMVMALSLYLL